MDAKFSNLTFAADTWPQKRSMARHIKFTVRSSWLLAAGFMQIALFFCWQYLWSGCPWSPWGYETCGLEYLVMFFFVWPSLLISLLLRATNLFRIRNGIPALLPPLVGLIFTVPFKSVAWGAICAGFMPVVLTTDLWGMFRARYRNRPPRRRPAALTNEFVTVLTFLAAAALGITWGLLLVI